MSGAMILAATNAACSAAVAAVLAAEALALGEPFAGAIQRAKATLDEARAAALGVLFPSALTPTSPETLAQYQFATERLARTSFGAGLAAAHRRALGSHPGLEALLRSREALADVGGAADAAHGMGAGAAAVAIYELAIARNLSSADGTLGNAARDLIAVAELAERLVAAGAKHEAHAVAELALAERARVAAARAVREEADRRLGAAAEEADAAAVNAGQAGRNYLRLRSERLAERLRASGFTTLKRPYVLGHELFEVADLLGGLQENGYTIEAIERFEAALEAQAAR